MRPSVLRFSFQANRNFLLAYGSLIYKSVVKEVYYAFVASTNIHFVQVIFIKDHRVTEKLKRKFDLTCIKMHPIGSHSIKAEKSVFFKAVWKPFFVAMRLENGSKSNGNKVIQRLITIYISSHLRQTYGFCDILKMGTRMLYPSY